MIPGLMVTLWPSMPHFHEFAKDTRLSGVRLNSAMMSSSELDEELATLRRRAEKGIFTVPLWYDIKGRQPRVVEVHPNPSRLEITLNHKIQVETPTPVLFKAGADGAMLDHIEGDKLIFRGGPQYKIKPGESLHIRHPSLVIEEPLFTKLELEKIEKVKAAGIKKWFLSYVEKQSDVDQFLELVGKDAEVMLKIESQKGLNFVANSFKKKSNLRLVAARGDLYVEIEKPHTIANALRLIIEKDKEAQVGSRMLLSVIQEPVPSCSDFLDLAWLVDAGYRELMLCDELCLKGELLTVAVNAFDAFRTDFISSKPLPWWKRW